VLTNQQQKEHQRSLGGGTTSQDEELSVERSNLSSDAEEQSWDTSCCLAAADDNEDEDHIIHPPAELEIRVEQFLFDQEDALDLKFQLAEFKSIQRGLLQRNSNLRCLNQKLRRHNAKLLDLAGISPLMDPLASASRKKEDLTTKIEKSLGKLFENYGSTSESRRIKFGKVLAKVTYSFADGVAHDPAIRLAKEWLRCNVFSPWHIARVMDLNGGTLNLKGYDLIRKLELRDWLLPSPSSIQRVFALVEVAGDKHAPFELKKKPGGEAIVFNYEKVVALVVASFGLAGAAMLRGVRLAQSIDGANLTRTLCHVMAGIKMNDPGAINPLTREPLFAANIGVGVQSRNVVFPMQIQMGRETDAMYDDFKPMFDFMQSTNESGIFGWEPFVVSTECDLSAQWKGLKKGGAAKVKEYFCQCCGRRSEEIHHPNPSLCDRWCFGRSNPDGTLRCYHESIVTDEVLASMTEDLSLLQATLGDYIKELPGRSQLEDDTDPNNNDGRENQKMNPKSIWFEPTNREETRTFSELVNAELILRNEVPVVSLSARREQLRLCLGNEWALCKLQEEVTACDRPQEALFLLMNTIPCILHMEMRVGLKILTMLILEGKSVAETTGPEIGASRRVDEYMALVQKTVNETILGTVTEPTHWIIPWDRTTKKLGSISMENGRVRKILSSIDVLIDISIADEARRAPWQRCIPKYREGIEMVRRKESFSPDDIGAFQGIIDDWFRDWVGLHGSAGMTNYVHMLCTGHIAEYLVEWGNLYEHSQQGWEAFNSLLKTFFFRRTGRGGGRGIKSKLKPIARWLQRRMMWHCGITKENIGQKFLEQNTDQLIRDFEKLVWEDGVDDCDICDFDNIMFF